MSIPRTIKEVLKNGIANYEHCINGLKYSLTERESWFDNPENKFGESDRQAINSRIAGYEILIVDIQTYIEENE